MSFHKSNFGKFGEIIPSDIDGYVPTCDTGPWELTYDHGTERTHDGDGNLTEYGVWWEQERFPELQLEALEWTIVAEILLEEAECTQLNSPASGDRNEKG